MKVTGDLPRDATAFLRRHGRDGVAAHVARVAAEAERLADREGVGREAALAAAWLHDISQVLPSGVMVEAAARYGIDILPEERQVPSLLHGKLSALFAARLFGVADPAVLTAISCHTTLRAGATRLDKLLFVADKLSWDEADAPYRPALVGALEQSLDAAVACFLNWGWEGRERLPVIHPWFRAAYAESQDRHRRPR